MIKRVNLDSTGLGMFLGPTEVLVMRALWHGPKTMQTLHTHIVKHYKEQQGYSAVNTVLARLIEKGYVKRCDDRGQHAIYKPMTLNERDFVFACLLQILHQFIYHYPNIANHAYDAAMNRHDQDIEGSIYFIAPQDSL